MTTVLVLAEYDDAHALHVVQALRDRGRHVLLLDSRSFPQHTQLTLDPSGAKSALHVPGSRPLPLREISSVYWRNYSGISAPRLPHPDQSYIAHNDARSLFEGMLRSLPCRWVNGWEGYELHQAKPAALQRVAAAGVPIPATLSTNDPQELRQFVAQYGNCIFKPVQGGAHTQRVTLEQLTGDHDARLRAAPVTVQQEISGTNVRAFVAGHRVLACEIATAEIDFRDDPNPRIVGHSLPEPISRRSRQVADLLHLVWAGIDYRLTPEGEYVFLEANPSPMFLGFEQAASLPLTEALIDLLQ